MAERIINLGVIGLGRAFTLMLPTLTADARFRLRAAADPRPEARALFSAEFGTAYATPEQLCADPAVEAIYIASPHQLHAQHVALASAAGKHVLLEKPMALTLADCDAMVAAARQAKVHLIVGHSHSFDRPIQRARELIRRGEFGQLRMITALNFTDFLYRPRRPEELHTAQGGGVVFSQGAHQIDVLRLLGGGMVSTVTAHTGAWDKTRPTEGAYSALLAFADGAFASATYSGYAHYDSDELMGGVNEQGEPKPARRYGAARRVLASAGDPQHEAALKNARAYGGPAYVAPAPVAGLQHHHFGFLIASCDKADLRPLPSGVMIYGDTTQRMDSLPPPSSPRAEVMDELHAAVAEGRSPLHNGEWARATLEVCLGILTSAAQGRPVRLTQQVPAGGPA